MMTRSPEQPPLRDTTESIDVSLLPDDPHMAWEVIRQATRAGDIKTGGKPAFAQPEYAEHFATSTVLPDLYPEPLQKYFPDTVTQVSLLLARQRGFNLHSRKRARPLEPDELERADRLFAAYVEDVIALDQDGFKAPVRLATYHSPAFYRRVFEAYQSSHNITPGRIREIFRMYPRDPVTKIDDWITKKQHEATERPHAKRSRSHVNSTGQTVLDALLAVSGGQREGMERVRSEIIKNNKKNPLDEYTMVCRGVTRLLRGGRREYMAESTSTLAHFAYRYPSPDGRAALQALERYRTALIDARDRYADDEDLTHARIQHFTRQNLETVFSAVTDYKDRIAAGEETVAAAGLAIPRHVIRDLAYRAKSPVTVERAQKEYEKQIARQPRQQRPLEALAGWMFAAVASRVEESKRPQTLRVLHGFVARGYIAGAVAETRTGWGSLEAQGRYMVIDPAVLPLGRQDADRLLRQYGIDQIVSTERLSPDAPPLTASPADLLPAMLIDETGWRDDPTVALALIRKRIPERQHEQADGMHHALTRNVLGQLERTAYRGSLRRGPLRAAIGQLMEQYRIAFPSRHPNPSWAHDIAVQYVADVQAIAEMGLESAHDIALQHSAQDVRRYQKIFEAHNVSPEMAHTFLGSAEPGVAFVRHVHRERQRMQFHRVARVRLDGLGVPPDQVQELCGAIESRDQLTDALDAFVAVHARYAGNPFVGPTVVSVILRHSAEPVATIDRIVTIARGLAARYGDAADVLFLRQYAPYRDADTNIEKYMARKQRLKEAVGAYDAIDDWCLEFLAHRHGSNALTVAREHIKAWGKYSALPVDFVIDPTIFRRIIVTDQDNALFHLRTYTGLRRLYRTNRNIAGWMVDAAFLRGTNTGAAKSLKILHDANARYGQEVVTQHLVRKIGDHAAHDPRAITTYFLRTYSHGEQALLLADLS